MRIKFPPDIESQIRWIEPHTSLELPKIKLEPLAKTCEDCNRVVTDRVVNYRKCLSPVYKPHFKAICSICGLYQNPTTGVFDCDRGTVDNYHRRNRKN